MSTLKEWLIETWGPSAIRGGLLGVVGILMAHTAILSKFGIITDAVTNTTTIHWTKLSDAVVPIVIAIVAGFIKTGHVQLTGLITSVQGETK